MPRAAQRPAPAATLSREASAAGWVARAVAGEAEDTVQEAYLRAWRALPEFSTESKLSTWLVCIAAPSGCWRARRCARCDRIVAKVLARAGAEGLWRDADPA